MVVEEPPTRRRGVVVGAVVVGAVALLLGTLFGPALQRLSAERTGDPDLAARVDALVGGRGGLRALAVAEVTPAGVTWAGLGNATSGHTGPPPGPDTRFELGSITKTFTGALLADAIVRGEVDAADRLGDHLPELGGHPAGGVTLGALAQHRSGLPRLGATAAGPRAWLASVRNDNPYATSSTAVLLADARAAEVDTTAPPTYSNLGIALLGTALARAADAPDYAALVAERLTGPLGMTATTLAATDADVPTLAAPGFTSAGRPASRWTGEGYLPAGSSTFSTAGDVATWARAQLDGTAPGLAALDATADMEGTTRVGWTWFTETTTAPDGSRTETVWHNGGTGGFRSMLALDRDAGRAVVVLSSTTADVDGLAESLLEGTGLPGGPTVDRIVPWALYALGAAFALLALRAARHRETRLSMIETLLTAVFGLLLTWHLGPWSSVGGWAWGLLVAVTAAAGVLAAQRAPALPWAPARQAWVAWLNAAIAALLVAAAAALL